MFPGSHVLKKIFGSTVVPPEVGGRNYLRQKLAEAGRQLPDSCLDEIVRRVLRAIAEVPSIRLKSALDIEADYIGYAILGDQWIEALGIHARLVWYVLDGGPADPEHEAFAEPMRALLFRHGVSFVER